MARRFFVERKNIQNNKSLKLVGQEHVHLTKVLRAKINDEIVATTDDGYEIVSKIESIDKNETICSILSQKKIEDKLLNITLFQGAMKGEHMELLIQKATELNIKTLIPFESQYTVAKIDDKKIDRFKKISQEACKQSNRSFPMNILNALSFKGMLEELKHFDQIVFAYENSRNSAKDILKKLDSSKSIALIVGAEGGFSEQEAKRLEELGSQVISLGKNILRGETAGITLISIVIYELNQFN